MRRCYLYGELANRFGPRLDLEVDTAAAAIRCLAVNFKRHFTDLIKEGEIYVLRGDLQRADPVTDDTLGLGLGKDDLHIAFVPAGAKGGKGKAVFTIVLGVALAATGVGLAADAAAAGVGGVTGTATTLVASLGTPALFGLSSYGGIALMGAGLILSGVAGLLTKTPSVGDTGAPPDQRASFIFNNPVNAAQQGTVVPLVYGEFLCGSVVVSSGLEAEAVAG